jgi:UDP-N-acetylmuramate--alanine ligase
MLPDEKYLIDVNRLQRFFFMGVAGSGMSALAQYVAGLGKQAAGSDRQFQPEVPNAIQQQLEDVGVRCFPQDGSGLTPDIELVVVSTAIESTVPEVAQAQAWGIPIVRRSELLAALAASRRTIAVGGTSGKSTTTAMIYAILEEAGFQPGIISGAGLVELIQQGKIGNAAVGGGEWLVIEADESDGSIVQYHPEIGVLLNIDKDHQELDELERIFRQFQQHTRSRFIVNRQQALTASLSTDRQADFSSDPSSDAGFVATDFHQDGFQLSFRVNGFLYRLHTVGAHNMENALAALAVTLPLGVLPEKAAKALERYAGIHRRHQILGVHQEIIMVDDYAHNPAKCAASIKAVQPLAPRVVAWFQPHGYGPTRFLRQDFVDAFADVLRPQDELWMSEIYFAGGTAVKDISAGDLIDDLQQQHKPAFFESDRQVWMEHIVHQLKGPAVLLLMGARDPSLEAFAHAVWNNLKQRP